MKYFLLCVLIQPLWCLDVFGPSVCGDHTWIPFQDRKCFKLIDRMVNREDANTICVQEDSSNDALYPPSLIIKSQDEQEFVTNFIFNQSKVVDNVWLGALRESGSIFHWDDGTEVVYSNWATGNPSNDSEKRCVQITSRLSKNANPMAIDGQWSDVSCARRNVVVCQKVQIWSNIRLQKLILELQVRLAEAEEEILETKAKLKATSNDLRNVNSTLENTKSSLDSTINNLQTTDANLQTVNSTLQTKVSRLEFSTQTLERNPVPIGYIYTQLYNQPTPSTLWPNLTWSEVSSTYAGLFFRAVGGNSAAFGSTQEENAPRVVRVETVKNKWTDIYLSTGLPVGGKSDRWLFTGSDGLPGWAAVKFETSGGEVRPRNQAVRLWKRTS